MISESINNAQNRIKKNFDDKDFLELFQKGGVAMLFRIGGQILGFILTFVIAYFFGANGLGDYVLAIVVLKIFTLISKLGLDTASIRFIASYCAEKSYDGIVLFRKKAMSIILITSILSSILMYFGAEIIAELIGGYSFFFWMSQALFTLIVILILTIFSKDENIPIYSYLIGMLVISVLSFFMFSYFLKRKKESNDFLTDIEVNESFSNILKISLPLMLAQAVHFIMSWTDKLMLGILDSPDVVSGLLTNSAQIGVYHTAFKLSMFATIGLMAIKSIASPKFAELYKQNEFKLLEKVTQQSTKLIFWTTLPLVIVFILFSEKLMLLFGDEFRVGIFSFIILSLGRVVVSFSGAAGNLLQMCGKQVIFMNVAIVGSLVNIILNLSLIPIYGIDGSAIATMISLIVFNLLLVYFVKREFGFYTFYIPFKKLN